MPEGKQESKPMTPPPVITPEIIPETLPLQRPKPAFNTVPRPGSCMNKAHTQDLKADSSTAMNFLCFLTARSLSW